MYKRILRDGRVRITRQEAAYDELSVVLGCLGAANLGLGMSAVFAEDGAAVPVSAFLCDTSVHAVQFADVKAQGEIDEMAVDRVGRLAKAEVCGRYAGIATIESESITLKDGVAYKLTAFRFKEDQRIAWMAEMSFAPAHAAWDL